VKHVSMELEVTVVGTFEIAFIAGNFLARVQ
jgi:hypothetical protein